MLLNRADPSWDAGVSKSLIPCRKPPQAYLNTGQNKSAIGKGKENQKKKPPLLKVYLRVKGAGTAPYSVKKKAVVGKWLGVSVTQATPKRKKKGL